jgi:hypothetical protein
MTKQRFEELQKRNQSNQMMLCYELFCEEKKQISLEEFNNYFQQWLFFNKGGSIQNAIDYYRVNKVK